MFSSIINYIYHVFLSNKDDLQTAVSFQMTNDDNL